MSTNLDIKVRHLTRVEGHGDIVVNMRDGVLEKAELDIVEAPRYFEAMLKGRSFHEAAIITSRICGICSLGHQITSLKATEQALGLEVSEQTVLLRKLLIHGATLQSNVLHAYFLAAPGPAGPGLGVPAGRDPPRGGQAGPAHEAAGQRHRRRGLGACRAPHHAGAGRLHPHPAPRPSWWG